MIKLLLIPIITCLLLNPILAQQKLNNDMRLQEFWSSPLQYSNRHMLEINNFILRVPLDSKTRENFTSLSKYNSTRQLFITGDNWEFAGRLTFLGNSDQIVMNIATSLNVNQSSRLELSFYNSSGLPEGYFKPMVQSHHGIFLIMSGAWVVAEF